MDYTAWRDAWGTADNNIWQLRVREILMARNARIRDRVKQDLGIWVQPMPLQELPWSEMRLPCTMEALEDYTKRFGWVVLKDHVLNTENVVLGLLPPSLNPDFLRF